MRGQLEWDDYEPVWEVNGVPACTEDGEALKKYGIVSTGIYLVVMTCETYENEHNDLTSTVECSRG